jgi:hypothetical protein
MNRRHRHLIPRNLFQASPGLLKQPLFARIYEARGRIAKELTNARHWAVFEPQLSPYVARERGSHDAGFAKQHGWRLRFYKEGFCAIFDEDEAHPDDGGPRACRSRGMRIIGYRGSAITPYRKLVSAYAAIRYFTPC